MKLRDRFKNAEQAWVSFLEFSPGSLEIIDVNSILSEGVKNPEGLLVEKGLGKYGLNGESWRNQVSRFQRSGRSCANGKGQNLSG